MKKIFTLIGAALLSVSTLNAQTPVEQGNFIIDPYIGIPNWANSLLYSTAEDADDELGSTSSLNFTTNGGFLSYGGRFEYLVADNFGVGVDVNYEVSGYNYDVDSSYNDQTGMYTVGPFNRDYVAKKTRIMARLNYHFVQNERLDVYAGFAGGYKIVSRTKATNDPNWSTTTLDKALVPVSIRLAIGTRIYFTDNIGAMLELGAFGGGLLQVGVSAKF